MNQENIKIIETLKGITVYDFLMNYLNQNNNDNKSSSVVYTAKQLQAMYPKLFSKYKLEQAIKNEHLPHFKSGRERYFVKEEIDTWIKNKNKME